MEREVVRGRSGDSERAERRAERGQRNWADSEEVRVQRGGGGSSAIVFAGVVVVEGCGAAAGLWIVVSRVRGVHLTETEVDIEMWREARG